MKILDRRQIRHIIKRLAYEIVENHFDEEEIILAGINRNGFGFAALLQAELEAIDKVKIRRVQIRLNPAAPLSQPVEVSIPLGELEGRVIIVADDVANTGRTAFFACKPLMDILPKKVEVAVLVDRKHKAFPIVPDYVGLSLATTLKENIDVRILEEDEQAVFLN
jgi:pyrimidine operon attenuation protein/uracil phosphoribosyltransferase